MAPNGARMMFPTNPDLANISGRTDLDFENFYFLDFFDSKFPDVQVPRFLAWAGLGRAGAGLRLSVPFPSPNFSSSSAALIHWTQTERINKHQYQRILFYRSRVHLCVCLITGRHLCLLNQQRGFPLRKYFIPGRVGRGWIWI